MDAKILEKRKAARERVAEKKAAKSGSTKVWPNKYRELYTTLAAYWLEDQWQADPNNPSPMKGFTDRFGFLEVELPEGQTRLMQPKTTSKLSKKEKLIPKGPNESPKTAKLIHTDTVESYSETRQYNQAIPLQIEIQIKALELAGQTPGGTKLPPNFGWEDFKKKVSSGINELDKIRKVLQTATGDKYDLGHYLPIGRHIDPSDHAYGLGPPNVATSQRAEKLGLNRGGGAREFKDPKLSALAAMGVPRSWQEVVANYAIPEGTPHANNMFGNSAELEAFVQWTTPRPDGTQVSDAEVNDYLGSLPSSKARNLKKYDVVSGLQTGPGVDTASLGPTPKLPPAKYIKQQQILRNTIKATGLDRSFQKKEALFGALDALSQGDWFRAGGELIRLSGPRGATATIVGEQVNTLTKAATGSSLPERFVLMKDPDFIELEHAVNKAKNLKNNRNTRQVIQKLTGVELPEVKRFAAVKNVNTDQYSPDASVNKSKQAESKTGSEQIRKRKIQNFQGNLKKR